MRLLKNCSREKQKPFNTLQMASAALCKPGRQAAAIRLIQFRAFRNVCCSHCRSSLNHSSMEKKMATHLEKEMATRSSILAWKRPWTEELGGLQSMGLHD